MSVYPDSVTIEMMFDGVNWTNVSADVIGSLQVSYGILSNRPTDRIGSTGTLKFAMNNSERNSAKLIGYYSPGHANCRTGFAVGLQVRVNVKFEGDTRVKFYGRIAPEGIQPEPGIKGSRLTAVEVHDFMEQMANYELDQQTVQPNIKLWEFIPIVCGMMAIKPTSYELNSTEDTFPFIFDDTEDGTVALTEVAKGVLSELGYVYLKFGSYTNEIMVVDGRKTRQAKSIPQIPKDPATLGKLKLETNDYILLETNDKILMDESAAVTLDNQMHALTVSPRTLANLVTVSVFPRTRDAAATSVLWSNSSELTLAAGASTTITGTYRNPTGGGSACGVDMVPPVATTDYTMFTATNGGGSDVTANLTVSAVFKTNKVTVTLTNTTAANGYINKLQVRGRGIYKYDASSQISQDATSIAAYGKNPLKINMNYNVDPVAAKIISDKLLSFYKDLGSTASEVYFHANRSRELMWAFLAFEPGTRINIVETLSAVNANYFINGVTYTISPGANRWGIDFGWYIKPAAEEAF
jgi:hypothetical protein